MRHTTRLGVSTPTSKEEIYLLRDYYPPYGVSAGVSVGSNAVFVEPVGFQKPPTFVPYAVMADETNPPSPSDPGEGRRYHDHQPSRHDESHRRRPDRSHGLDP